MKKNKILYWSFTGLISAGFLFSGFLHLSKAPEMVSNFEKLGYPAFFITIIGFFKLTGALAIVNPWFPKLKEWAYAGFTFLLVGATWTHVATQTPFVAPVFFLVLLGLSYFFYNKVNKRDKEE